MMHRQPPGSTGRLAPGAGLPADAPPPIGLGPVAPRRAIPGTAGGAHGASGFAADCRQACIAPHAAQEARHPAIDGRTTRHKGHALSQRHGKRIGELFGRSRTVGGAVQTVHRGIGRVRSRFVLTLAAASLARLPRLLAI
ncbi:hypothetical protein [Mangrovicoccus sp. HB161399]|uniref:hypothetical protein n=1 Tax=Mangrovicoccus sp. HB161399 TaxID=2720392 RepID=UPI001556D896|nr:hypothetical protein [Mangrovicoccus sp. HB161399]